MPLKRGYQYQSYPADVFIWADEVPKVFAVKDKDVPTDVLEYGNYGFAGSDVIDEYGQNSLVVEKLAVVPNCRLALLTTTDKRADVQAKLDQGECLSVGTSYPTLTRSVLGPQASIDIQRSGSIESLPGRFPWLDGVVEIVRSGDSAAMNGLSVVADDLYQVTLLGLERNTFQP